MTSLAILEFMIDHHTDAVDTSNHEPASSNGRGNDDIVHKALTAAKQAEELKGAAISRLLELRSQIDVDLKTHGYIPLLAITKNGSAKNHGQTTDVEQKRSIDGKAFKDMTLAEASRKVLSEYGTIHGAELERILKQGGLRNNVARFQGYLAVALKRDGGFENIGGNTWKLRDAKTPE